MFPSAYLSTVAQIIPLLMITILVERRFLPVLPESARSGKVAAALNSFVAFCFVAFAFTEGEVLWALHGNKFPSKIDDDVRATLILAACALLAPVIQRAISSGHRERQYGAYFVGFVMFSAAFAVAGLASR